MQTAIPASVLAFVTTIHVALAVLRKYRTDPSGRFGIVLVPSILFCAAPWLLSEPTWLAGALAAHLAWFLACEKAIPRRGPAKPATVAAPRPAVSPILTSPPAPASTRASLPRGFVPVPVLAVFEETTDIKTFRLARPEGFEFQAGQFLTVGMQVDGKRVTRCYSISSAPEARGYLEISVKQQGLVSGTLHAIVHAGSILSIRPPAGRFVYPAGDDRPIVLVAGGVGCTPLFSMLRHAVSCDPQRQISYLLSVKTEQDIAFRQELSLITRRHPQVRVAVALSRGSAGPGFFSGRISPAMMEQTVTDPAHSLFYLCGPGPMLESVKKMLAELGVPQPQVRFEAFEAAVAWAKETSSASVEAPAELSLETSAAPAPKKSGAAGARGSFHLKLVKSGRTAKVAGGQTLLEAAGAAGVTIPSSCGAGICGTCRTRLVSGEVDCDGDALGADERQEGYILPCVAMAKSDCELEA